LGFLSLFLSLRFTLKSYMQITIDAHLAEHQIDGVARYLIGLLNELPSLDRSIHYTVLDLPRKASGLPDHLFEQNNVTRIEVWMNGPSVGQHFIMRYLLQKSKADLYHHPQFDLPIGIKIPTVVTIHDLKHLRHPNFFTRKIKLKKWYFKRSLLYSAKHSSQIVAVSQNTKEELEEYVKFDYSKVRVIHHGVNMPPMGSRVTSGTAGTSMLPNAYILFIGTRRPHKNIENLIRMLAILRTEYKFDIHLLIAGKAYADYNQPEKTARDLSMEPFTHFLDFVPEEDLPKLYRSSSIVALPSFYEGFGFPLLEAMSYGKPVIGSNSTSIPEVLGDAGLLFDPNSPTDMASQAAAILSSSEFSAKLSNKALQRAKCFSWKQMAEKTLEVYLKALSNQTK